MSEGYNGWPNYETWRVNLEFFDGDDFERYYDWFKEYTGEFMCYDLGQFLSYEVDEAMDSNNDIASSYARAFISEVDWTRIAKHACDRICEAVDTEDA